MESSPSVAATDPTAAAASAPQLAKHHQEAAASDSSSSLDMAQSVRHYDNSLLQQQQQQQQQWYSSSTCCSSTSSTTYHQHQSYHHQQQEQQQQATAAYSYQQQHCYRPPQQHQLPSMDWRPLQYHHHHHHHYEQHHHQQQQADLALHHQQEQQLSTPSSPPTPPLPPPPPPPPPPSVAMPASSPPPSERSTEAATTATATAAGGESSGQFGYETMTYLGPATGNDRLGRSSSPPQPHHQHLGFSSSDHHLSSSSSPHSRQPPPSPPPPPHAEAISFSEAAGGCDPSASPGAAATDLSSLRPHSTPATLCWLERNYELCEGICIPRNVVYFNYVDFCSKNLMQPVNAASFGKIIRQMFASLTTRRLGTRGQSRYHYYGLAVKPDSIYYSPNYSSRKMTEHPAEVYSRAAAAAAAAGGSFGFRTLDQPHEQTQQHQLQLQQEESDRAQQQLHHQHQLQELQRYGSYAQQQQAGFSSCQQLPEFPTLGELRAVRQDHGSGMAGASLASTAATSAPSPATAASPCHPEKIQTLMTMYRAHCQRVMDSVNKFSFTEIPHLFSHFWKELPPHIAGLLGQNLVVTVIGACDAILYRTILRAVLPTATQMFPENVLKIIRKFADDVVVSLQFSLKQHHVPDNLVYVKMKLVRQLSKLLKRRTSVNHLYQAACLVVNPGMQDTYDQMVADWQRVEVKKVVEDCGTKGCGAEDIRSMCDKFGELLSQRLPMAHFCQWISAAVEAHACGRSTAANGGEQASEAAAGASSLVSRMRRLLAAWTGATSKMLVQLKAMSKSSATTYSSFHLVYLMLNEFLLHEVERLVCEDSMRELMVNMVNSQATELSESAFVESLGPDFLSGSNLFGGGSGPYVTAAAAATGGEKQFTLKKSKRDGDETTPPRGRKKVKVEKEEAKNFLEGHA